MKIPAREREHQAASPGGGRVCGALIVFLLSVLAEDHKLTSIGDQSKADSADKPSADSGDQRWQFIYIYIYLFIYLRELGSPNPGQSFGRGV